ncbi:MAG: DUF3267 domain-containing protein [Prolixibacteraceae bacterium]
MEHQLSPSDLHKHAQFELIQAVPYAEMKDFVLTELKFNGPLIKIYSFVQLFAAIGLIGIVLFYLMQSVQSKSFAPELLNLFLAAVCSIPILIPLHEGIHALAYLIKGKRDLSFGAQWKKFLFYAESNMQVLDRREMQFVALLPLITITVLGTIGMIVFSASWLKLFCCILSLIHLFFCSGDMVILSFFQRQLPNEVFTYDNRKEKKTYYFRKRASITV